MKVNLNKKMKSIKIRVRNGKDIELMLEPLALKSEGG